MGSRIVPVGIYRDRVSHVMCSLIKAIWLGLAPCVFALAQSSHTMTAQLKVEIRSEAVLAWQGGATVAIETRISPGAFVTIWQEEFCTTPAAGGHIISTSGRYTIPLASIG